MSSRTRHGVNYDPEFLDRALGITPTPAPPAAQDDAAPSWVRGLLFVAVNALAWALMVIALFGVSSCHAATGCNDYCAGVCAERRETLVRATKIGGLYDCACECGATAPATEAG